MMPTVWRRSGVREAALAEAPGAAAELPQPAIDRRRYLPGPQRWDVDAATGPKRLQQRLLEGASPARVVGADEDRVRDERAQRQTGQVRLVEPAELRPKAGSLKPSM